MIACARGAAVLALALMPVEVLAQSCNAAGRSILLILDASGSMNAPLPGGGQTRLAAMQDAVQGFIGLVPSEANLALRLFGSQSQRVERNCEDTILAVPLDPAGGHAEAFAAAVEGITAQGLTPLAGILEAAAEDLGEASGARVVILVSDGKEACKGDPVGAARALASAGIVVNALGFMADAAARMQLEAVARVTGGSYADAPDAASLAAGLVAALDACAGAVPPAPDGSARGVLAITAAPFALPILAAGGAEAGQFAPGTTSVTLPAGVYEVRFGPGRWAGIEVRPGETTTIAPAELRLEPTTDVTVVDVETGVSYGDFSPEVATRTLMPGLYDLRFQETVWRFIAVAGGTTTVLRPASVELDPAIKWKDHAYVTAEDGAIVARFDEDMRIAILPPGQYVVDIDEAKLPFDAGEPGAVLEVRLQ